MLTSTLESKFVYVWYRYYYGVYACVVPKQRRPVDGDPDAHTRPRCGTIERELVMHGE